MGGGACLSHDHSTQYRFVLQSFTLWKEIMANMPKLWLLADSDMIKEAYRLVGESDDDDDGSDDDGSDDDDNRWWW